MKPEYFFTYGLYMKSMPLHEIIEEDVEFIRNYVIDGYRLYTVQTSTFGSLPVMFHTGKTEDKVVGELYKIKDDSMLDRISKDNSFVTVNVDCRLDWDCHVNAVSFIGNPSLYLYKKYIEINGSDGSITLYPNGVRWR